MKDLFRLVCVALLSFAVVGAAMFYSKNNDAAEHLKTAVSSIKLPTKPVITSEVEQTRAEGMEHKLFIPRPKRDRWVGLAGFPASSELTFFIPSGHNYTRGQLDLNFESQLTAVGDGRMTITVKGKRRGEVVLDHGKTQHHVQIDLEMTDLQSRSVLLQLDGQGTTGGGQVCPANGANSGAAISLLADSGLSLYSTTPFSALDARIASLPDPLKIALGSDIEKQAEVIGRSMQLSLSDADVLITSNGPMADLVLSELGQEPLALDSKGRISLEGNLGVDKLIAARGLSLNTLMQPLAWPVTADALGAETTIKNFRGIRRWYMSYNVADLEDGALPELLNLELRAALLAPGNEWSVRVSLNGNMLKTARFDGQSELISMLVDLPDEKQNLSNDILIELIDTSPNQSICKAGPDAQAQLLPTTTLVRGQTQILDSWHEVVQSLAESDTVYLRSEIALSEAQANTARTILSSIVPRQASLVFNEDVPAQSSIDIFSGAHLRATMRLAGQISGDVVKDLFLVNIGISGIEIAPLVSPEASSKIDQLRDDDVALIIRRQR